MLGNGFDLYHDLPTEYINFIHTFDHLYKYYSNSIPANLDEVFRDCRLQKADSRITKTHEMYSEIYKSLTFPRETHKKIIELKDNYWYIYFSKCCNQNLTWIDFEKEIAYVLKSFSDFFETNEFIISFETLMFRCNNSIINHFSFFFEKAENTNGYYSFLSDYIYEKPVGSNNKNIDKDRIYEGLYRELLDLAEMLKIYLCVFVQMPLIKMSDQGLVKTNDLFTNYDSIITFNYTNTYQVLYNDKPIHYIHGNLYSNIVLGINPDNYDELLNIDTSYIMFKKYYQRVLYRTDTSFINMISNIRKQRKGLPHEYNTLTVCGHSLDVTDKDIIKDVFDISDSIIVICHELNKIGDYVSNLIKIYGKTEFDRIRNEKQLSFVTYNEWKEKQLEQAFVEGLS